MSDLMQLTETDIALMVQERGALPMAPLSMPPQVLERVEGGWLAGLLRLRLVQAPKTGL